MTTQEILRLARAKLLETTSEIITDENILLYANLSQDDIIKRTFTNDQILTATIALTSGVGPLPQNFGTMYGEAYTTDNKFFGELSIADFKKETQNQAVTIEGGNIKVIPTATASIIIKYYPTYPALTNLVNPTLNPYFHELMVYGVIYRAHEDLQDEALSKYYSEKYELELAKKSAVQSNYEEDNQRAGQMFTEQSLISDSGFSNSPNYF